MIQRYKTLAVIILASWVLDGCGHEPVQVADYEFCGWLGAAGGPGNACSCAHTVHTEIPVAHYDLNTCFQKLIGSVFLQGQSFNRIQASVDTLCTETGICTYEQKQYLATSFSQIQKVIPRTEKPH